MSQQSAETKLKKEQVEGDIQYTQASKEPKPPKQPKEPTGKPKDDWKAKAEAKKLKKEQDRVKEKQKEKEKPKEAPVTKAEQSKQQQKTKPQSQKKPQQKSPSKKPQQPQPTTSSSLKPTSASPTLFSLQSLLAPLRPKSLKSQSSSQFSTRNLLQFTSQYFTQSDSVLLASQHQICKLWFQRDLCQVIDIWNLCQTSTRKQNIIRARYEDVSHLLSTTTKFLCGTTAIFQNGMVMSEPGTLALAVLAHEYRIPFVVMCETNRYCDVCVLEGDLKQHEGTHYDLIDPKYISVLITEAGPVMVCSIPTLVSALYE